MSTHSPKIASCDYNASPTNSAVRRSIAMAFAVTIAAWAANAETRDSSEELTYADRLPYVERPITAGHRHLDLHFGVSGEYVDYYRSYSSIGRPLAGFGAHLDATYGVTDYLEFGAGVGLNVPGRADDLPYVNADRYARINREWLPTGLELARAPYVLGNEYVTNPYLRGRVALLNRRPVYVGLDVAVTLPLAPHSCFTESLSINGHMRELEERYSPDNQSGHHILRELFAPEFWLYRAIADSNKHRRVAS